MRTLNLKRNHILFGFLVLALASSKSWLQDTNNFGTRDYASLSASNFNCGFDSTTNKLTGCAFSVEFTTSDGETHKEFVSSRMLEKTSTTSDIVKQKDGSWKKVETVGETQNKWSFTVASTGCLGCIEELDVLGDKLDDAAKLAIMAHVVSQLRAKKEEEIKKKQALAELQKDADKCKIRITNASSNPPEYEKLTGSDKRAERFQCRIDRIENSDMSHQKQREEFRRLVHSMNIEEIMFSNDPEDAEMFEQITNVSAANGFMNNYLNGLKEIHNQYDNIVKQAEVLANPYAYHPQLVAHAQYSMANLQDFSAAGIPPFNMRGRGGTTAFRDFSNEINTLAYRVIDRPESLLFDAPFSQFNCLDIYSPDRSRRGSRRGYDRGYSGIDCGLDYGSRSRFSVGSRDYRDYYDRDYDRYDPRYRDRYDRYSTRDDYYRDEFDRRGSNRGGRGQRTGRPSTQFSSAYQPGGTRFANGNRNYQNNGIWQSNRSDRFRSNATNPRFNSLNNGNLAQNQQQSRFPRPRR